LADWERNDDGTYTFYGYGRVIQDPQLKAILTDLVAGVPIKQVATERRLPEKAVKEIFRFFNKMADE
jgi:hypothetical protein